MHGWGYNWRGTEGVDGNQEEPERAINQAACPQYPLAPPSQITMVTFPILLLLFLFVRPPNLIVAQNSSLFKPSPLEFGSWKPVSARLLAEQSLLQI